MPVGSALHEELATGTLDRVQALIEGGADVNASGHWGKTPLIARAEFGQTKFVKMLIAAGANTASSCYLNTVWSGNAAQWSDKFHEGDYMNCIWLLLNPAAAKAEFDAEQAQAEAAGLSVGEWYKTPAAASHEKKRYNSLEWYQEWQAELERSKARRPMVSY